MDPKWRPDKFNLNIFIQVCILSCVKESHYQLMLRIEDIITTFLLLRLIKYILGGRITRRAALIQTQHQWRMWRSLSAGVVVRPFTLVGTLVAC